MKQFRTNMGIFILLPAFVIILMCTYLLVMYTRSYNYMNIINIGIDGIILIYYFVNFIYKVEVGSEWVVFYNATGKKAIKKDELGFIMYSGFLVKFVCKNRNFYMLTSPKGVKVLKELFKDIKKL